MRSKKDKPHTATFWHGARAMLVTGALGLLAACADMGLPEPEVPLPVRARVFDPLAYVAPELRPAAEALLLEADEAALTVENLAELRQAAEAYAGEPRLFPAVEEVSVPVPGAAPGVKVYVINARAGASRPAILYMHGGGYVAGSAAAGLQGLQDLALRHDCVVFSVDYRLAPETAFPGALEDNYAALRWVHEHAIELGVNPQRVMLMGESAGGGHAAMLAIAARDRGELPIHKQILVYPMLDDRTGTSVPVQPWVGRYLWNAQFNAFGWSSLLGVPAGSEVVPAGAVPARVGDLKGMPPTFIAVGSIDLFVDENIAWAQRLVSAGVATELLVVPGAFHGFDVIAPDTAVAAQFREAIDRAIATGVRNAPTSLMELPAAAPEEPVAPAELIPSEEGVISF